MIMTILIGAHHFDIHNVNQVTLLCDIQRLSRQIWPQIRRHAMVTCDNRPWVYPVVTVIMTVGFLG